MKSLTDCLNESLVNEAIEKLIEIPVSNVDPTGRLYISDVNAREIKITGDSDYIVLCSDKNKKTKIVDLTEANIKELRFELSFNDFTEIKTGKGICVHGRIRMNKKLEKLDLSGFQRIGTDKESTSAFYVDGNIKLNLSVNDLPKEVDIHTVIEENAPNAVTVICPSPKYKKKVEDCVK